MNMYFYFRNYINKTGFSDAVTLALEWRWASSRFWLWLGGFLKGLFKILQKSEAWCVSHGGISVISMRLARAQTRWLKWSLLAFKIEKCHAVLCIHDWYRMVELYSVFKNTIKWMIFSSSIHCLWRTVFSIPLAVCLDITSNQFVQLIIASNP